MTKPRQFARTAGIVHLLMVTIAEFWLVAHLLVKGVRTPTAGHLTLSADRA